MEDTQAASPERRLMLAILITAIMDATGQSCCNRAVDRERNRILALAWFRDASDDFRTVCDLAGMDPDYVRRAVLQYVAAGRRLSARGGGYQSNRKKAA